MIKLSREEKDQWIKDFRVRQYQQQEERYYDRFIYYRNKGYDMLEAKHAAVTDLQDYYEDSLRVMGMTRKRLDDYCLNGGYALKDIKGAW